MENCEPIRVMIVDDHQMVRDGLKVFLSVHEDIEVIADARDGQQALELCLQFGPDVVLMDIVMPKMDGPTATALLLEQCPQVQVIALTTFVEEELVQQAIQAGAISYLLKDVHPDRLAQAIRDAYGGQGTIDATAAQVLIQAKEQTPSLGNTLTKRELEVIRLLAQGVPNKEIAQVLNISLGTVRFHASNIYMKLGVSNRTEATRLAIEQGWIS
jgi:NarL family two-component system response regulator LiaR